MPALSGLRRLDRINWDFPSAGTPVGSVHLLHWFPGNFIPQIPAALIQVLSEPGHHVLDPFAGSGTTGIEAMALGRRATLSDANPVSIVICEAKVALQACEIGQTEIRKILSELSFDHLCRSDSVGSMGEGANKDLELWFHEDTLAQLRYIWQLVETRSGVALKKVLTAVFSDTLFSCASSGGAQSETGKRRRHHWGWIADNVRPRKLYLHNAVNAFRDRLVRLERMDTMYPRRLGGLDRDQSGTSINTARVIKQDARNLDLDDESVDLIVTSPPYLSVIDYTHANRLLYLWMGWDISLDRTGEIGARYRRKRPSTENQYIEDMRLAIDEMRRVLRAGGLCAIVIGESKKFPGAASRVLADVGESLDLIWGPKTRTPTRRRVSDRAALEPTEWISVFQKR